MILYHQVVAVVADSNAFADALVIVVKVSVALIVLAFIADYVMGIRSRNTPQKSERARREAHFFSKVRWDLLSKANYLIDDLMAKDREIPERLITAKTGVLNANDEAAMRFAIEYLETACSRTWNNYSR